MVIISLKVTITHVFVCYRSKLIRNKPFYMRKAGRLKQHLQGEKISSRAGLSNVAAQWFNSYLTGFRDTMQIDLPAARVINMGLLQGSVLLAILLHDYFSGLTIVCNYLIHFRADIKLPYSCV